MVHKQLLLQSRKALFPEAIPQYLHMILESLNEIAYREAKRSGELTLPGIGKLVKQQRKAREGRNPRTKETITIPASKNVRFKAGKDLRDLLNVAPKKKR